MNRSNIFNIVIGILVMVLSAMCGVFWNRVNSLESQVVNLRVEMANKVAVAKVEELQKSIVSISENMVEVKTTLKMFINNHDKEMK